MSSIAFAENLPECNVATMSQTGVYIDQLNNRDLVTATCQTGDKSVFTLICTANILSSCVLEQKVDSNIYHTYTDLKNKKIFVGCSAGDTNMTVLTPSQQQCSLKDGQIYLTFTGDDNDNVNMTFTNN